MMRYLLEILHGVQIVLTFIGGGTVLAFFGWLYKRRQENFEDKVLGMFANAANQQWCTATGNPQRNGEYLKDVPMWVILPTHNNRFEMPGSDCALSSAARLANELFYAAPETGRKNEKAILSLWKRELLNRDRAKPQYYKLRQ